ncbi:MAG: fused MFS/spermidine synthase [Desulfohalobiaceae bacterium]|nr:fused MFS/spermidine synthase [Desulfohalobiaceae bacterium]
MPQTDKHLIHALIAATGVSSVVTQLYAIRELLSQFSGNEFVISLIIFVWLILGGLGTLTAQTANRFRGVSLTALGWLSLLLACLSPGLILAIRFLRTALFTTGVSVGFYPVLGFICLVVGPLTFLVGFLLPYSLYSLRRKVPGYPGSRVYITDNLGDVSGGALFSFLLILFFTPLQALLLANLPLGLLSLGLIFLSARSNPLLLPAALLLVAGLGLPPLLSVQSLSTGHSGNLIHYQESKYQRIEVFRHKGQVTLFGDGGPMYSSRSSFLAEELVHYPLAQLDEAPQDVLLISARSDMLREIEKYDPDKVTYVELDPALTRVQFQYGLLQEYPGLRIIHQDARRYLSRTKQTFDAVIISFPQPQTFKGNRLFTREFFHMVQKHLSPSGVFSFSVRGYANYLSQSQERIVSCLHRTASQSFSRVLLLPGRRTVFLCRNGPLTANIPQRLRERGIRPPYIQGYFSGTVTQERISRLQERITSSAPVNRDLDPVLMRFVFSQWFAKHASSPLTFFALLGGLGIVYLLLSSREELVLFSTGFLTMGSEILIIFVFQIVFGYVYSMLGLIVTAFLAGLLPGALYGERLQYRGRRMLMATDLGLISCLGLLLLLLSLGWADCSKWIYLGLGFGIALLCGMQFPVALALKGDTDSVASKSFSADLFGAALGALLISVALIPYLGVTLAIMALMGLKIFSISLVGTPALGSNKR